MFKITLLILFCAISGYGISGQTHDKIETKVFNESAKIGKELLPPTNANLNPNSNNIVTQPLQVDSKQLSLTSNVNATDPQIKDTVASNAGAIKKEDSALPNTSINETTSANTLVDQSTPKNIENDSKKIIEDSNTDNNTKNAVVISTTPKSETTTTIKTTTTTIATTSTTAAPPVPLPTPKPGKWLLNESNITCIIVSMAVQFNVSDYSDKNNQTKYKVFNLPDSTNETKVSGSCGKLEQSIILQWNGTVNVTNTFTLHFSKNETTKQYHFHHLELNVTEGNQTSMFVHNATLFSTGLSNSYRCLKEQNFTFDSNTTKGYLLMSDLQFQAFKTDQNVNFGEVKDCKLDTPDIVPIAVGCALAVLVIIVLIAYLIGRKRSQSRGYLSM
ncbi:hypothetical protein M0804_012857 [Polistes exclamans]|nr:hypothetical protein M0804_012857 [Polistes exclamans]